MLQEKLDEVRPPGENMSFEVMNVHHKDKNRHRDEMRR